jgi:hypothetical protein
MLIATDKPDHLSLKDDTGRYCGSVQSWGFYAALPILPQSRLIVVYRDAQGSPQKYKGATIFAGWNAAWVIYSNRRRSRPSSHTE